MKIRLVCVSAVSCVLITGLATVASTARASAPTPTRDAPAVTSQASLQAPQNQAFYGVDGVASDDIWAVGRSGSLTKPVPLIRHWNGTRWRLAQTTFKHGDLNDVQAVSSDDVWAVGGQPTSGGVRPLIAHWNGTAWTEVAAPELDCADYRLYGVSSLSTDHVLATGWCYPGGEEQDRIKFLWDGSSWRTAGAEYADLLDIDGDESDGWGVGVGAGGTVAEHWDGHSWHRVDTPNYPGRLSLLQQVDVAASDDAWAYGETYSVDTTAFAEHWNGRRWKLIYFDPDMVFATGLTTTSSGGAWATGYTPGDRSFIEYWDGEGWSLQSQAAETRPDAELLDIKAISEDDVWSVGLIGPQQGPLHPLLLHWNGHKWSNETPKDW